MVLTTKAANRLLCRWHRFTPCLRQLLTAKMLLIMKLTAIILLSASLTATATGNAQKVTLSEKGATLETVFKEIKKQTGYSFFYNEALLKKSQPVTIEVKDVSLKDALDICFQNQPLSYSIVGVTVVVEDKKTGNNESEIVKKSLPPPAINVHGKVINEKGEPVEGVSVTVKGTKAGTTTNANGEFSLSSVDNEAVLVFTHVNMETFEIKVNGKTELTITLKTKISALGEVEIRVNTGYQQISKERFVGSFAQLDSANFHRRAGMGILERLNGTVTGLLFETKNAKFPIMIRGISTLGEQNTNTQPLIIVDNFPLDERQDFNLDNINPNDVESVTVLKDAAATSIWGARAGNGVIVITTKKGRYNQPFNINVSSNITIEDKPDLFYIPRVSPSDFIDVEKYLFSKTYYDASLSNPWTPVSPVVEILDRERNGIITTAEADNQINALRNYDLRDDLDKYIYRRAVRQQHYLNLSGGNVVNAYRFSLGYNRSLSSFQGSPANQQVSFNASNSFRPTKKLEFQTGVSITYGINKASTTGVPNSSPYTRLADDDGNPMPIVSGYRMGYVDTVGGGSLLDWHYRPLAERGMADNRTTSRFVNLNFGVSYAITNWLKAQVQYQYMNGVSNTRNITSADQFAARTLINYYTNPQPTPPMHPQYPVPKGGLLDLSNSQSQTHNLRGQLNFNQSWDGQHRINALVSGEISEGKGYAYYNRLYGYNGNNGTYSTVMDFVTQFPIYYGNYLGTAAAIPANNFYTEQPLNRFVSVLANVGYTYRDRYNFYASARRDGANIFGVNTNNKWKPLWSAGGSWDISKEKFYNIKWMPQLKLRASYGYAGNVNSTLTGKLTILYAQTPDFFSGLIYAGPSSQPNPDLKWEQVRTINTGLDFQLFTQKLSGSIDWFQKNASDVISYVPFAPSSGTDNFYTNAASLRTRGFDINLLTSNKIGAIGWSVGLGLSYAKTIVTKFFKNTTGINKAQDYISYALNPTKGQIAYGVSSYRWAGLDPANGDPQGYLNGQVSKNYTAIFNDTLKNQVFNGSALPLYTSFIRNDLSFKGLTLSMNITGRFNYYYRKPVQEINYNGDYSSYTADYYQRWQQPGDEANTTVPSMRYPNPSGILAQRNIFYQNAEINVKRGDNIRIQDIRLAYQWVNQHSKRIPVKSAQVFFYPNNLNLVIWRKEKDHYDPDVYGGSGAPIAPPSKTWTVGVNLNF